MGAIENPGRDHNGPPELVSEVEPQPERPVAPMRIGYRVNEWAALTGTSRETTYRRIKDGTLIAVKYGGVTLIKGLAAHAAE